MSYEHLKSDQWGTPAQLFRALDIEFEFDFDLCASQFNALCPFHTSDIRKYVDGVYRNGSLMRNYWCNPPYSRGNIEEAMSSVVQLVNHPDTNVVVTLTRFDPSTDWFQTYVDGVANEVRMLAHRVKFKGAKDSYNFPCCVAIYEGRYEPPTRYRIWDWKDD